MSAFACVQQSECAQQLLQLEVELEGIAHAFQQQTTQESGLQVAHHISTVDSDCLGR